MSIAQELSLIEAALNSKPAYYVDYDGQNVYLDPTPEEEIQIERVIMLGGLTKLTIPVTETEWILEMQFGDCCQH